MRHVPAAAPRSDLPFKYVGGDPSLDLVNTVDWTPGGLLNDRLTDYGRLVEWGVRAGVLSAAEGAALRRQSRSRPRAAAAALAGARRLRAVLQRLYRSIAAGTAPDDGWSAFNAHLSTALRRLRVVPGSARQRSATAAWAWSEDGRSLRSFLGPVVWSAARLIASDEAPRVRVCAGPDCGWMYVDRSRNGLRRWCEMATCGTEQKSRTRSKTRR